MGMFELERHERSSKGTYYLRVDKRTEMVVLAPFPLPTAPTFLKLVGQQVTAPPGTQCKSLDQDHLEPWACLSGNNQA